MSISTRQVGAVVACPFCRGDITVPDRDDPEFFESPPAEALAPPELPAPPPASSPAESAPPLQAPPPVRAEPLIFARPATAERVVEPPLDLEIEAEDNWLSNGRSRLVEEEMDLTAMVDVVFQLLIFFMVTASFSLQKTIELPTPDEPKQGIARALQPLEELQDVAVLVRIDDHNGITVDEVPLADLSLLPDVLRERMRTEQKSELIVTASRSATHRSVVAVIDAANEVGMQRIRMATSARNAPEVGGGT